MRIVIDPKFKIPSLKWLEKAIERQIKSLKQYKQKEVFVTKKQFGEIKALYLPDLLMAKGFQELYFEGRRLVINKEVG